MMLNIISLGKTKKHPFILVFYKMQAFTVMDTNVKQGQSFK